MSRLVLSLLEALGLAFCEKGRKCLQGYASFGNELSPVAEQTLKELRKHMPADQIRIALAETAAAPEAEYLEQLDGMIKGLCRVKSVPFRDELREYLAYMPLTIRQMFHRPSDPDGLTAPDKLDFYKPEQLLPFLPPRRPHFKPGDTPVGLDHWELRELRGLGECGEVWLGYDDDQPEHSPAALKFPVDKESIKRFQSSQDLFRNVFELNEINGIVPLRTVFLESDPPALEYAFVSGYDLTGVMHEWRWNYDHARPELAFKIFKKLVDTVAKAHKHGIVHRDLKPSNVLIHAGEHGRFSLWITDYGWGQIESIRSMELYRTGGTPKADQQRHALRGAYTPLYASPQQSKNEPAAMTDDVHALGVIWFQLLKRDPNATVPVGDDWAEEFLPHGFTKNQARILTACVAIRPDRRPADARALAEMLAEEHAHLPPTPGAASSATGDSKQHSTKTPSSTTHTPLTVASSAAATAVAPPPSKSAAIAASARPAAVPAEPKPASSTETRKLIRNAIGLCFVPIPPGTFSMGADGDENGHRSDETPRHTVRISKGFYLSTTAVTQSHFEKLTGRNLAFFHQRNGGSLEFPLESISYFDAERFCQKLMNHPDERLLGRVYRLPTEAEWEYACRAGSETPFSFGDHLDGKDAHYAAMTLKGQGKPCVVGHLPANAWGLYEMHGNVDEWVSDWYAAAYYATSPGADPHGPAKGEHKVIRGGSWAGNALDCRSAARKHLHPDKSLNTLGFRVVMAMTD